MKKMIALALSLALAVALGIGGTLAWLTHKTDEIKNTFSVGNINISLDEPMAKQNNLNFKMVPGQEIVKDPTVTVAANSEACWLFVKIEEGGDLNNFITYQVGDGWTPLDAQDYPGLYYRKVLATDTLKEFSVLLGDKVTVKGEDVTKGMMNDLEKPDAALPTLTFTAYAIQQFGFTTEKEAWEEVSKT